MTFNMKLVNNTFCSVLNYYLNIVTTNLNTLPNLQNITKNINIYNITIFYIYNNNIIWMFFNI